MARENLSGSSITIEQLDQKPLNQGKDAIGSAGLSTSSGICGDQDGKKIKDNRGATSENDKASFRWLGARILDRIRIIVF